MKISWGCTTYNCCTSSYLMTARTRLPKADVSSVTQLTFLWPFFGNCPWYKSYNPTCLNATQMAFLARWFLFGQYTNTTHKAHETASEVISRQRHSSPQAWGCLNCNALPRVAVNYNQTFIVLIPVSRQSVEKHACWWGGAIIMGFSRAPIKHHGSPSIWLCC